MTVLRTPSYWIAGKEVKVASNYSVRENEFYINVPEPVASAMDKDRVFNKDSLNAVERDFKALLKMYEEQAKTRREVLFYTFKSKVRPLDFLGDDGGRGISYGPDEVPTYGVGLDLWFFHGYTETNPNNNEKTYLDLNLKSIGNAWRQSEWKIMDYTPEREQFFVAFRNYLKRGIENMQMFFQPSNDIPALIDQAMQTKALPFDEKKE